MGGDRRHRRACPSGKFRYADRVGALLALADSSASAKARRNEVRAYHCPDCEGWHLTSRAAYVPPQLRRGRGAQRGQYRPPELGPPRPAPPGPALPGPALPGDRRDGGTTSSGPVEVGDGPSGSGTAGPVGSAGAAVGRRR